MAFFVAMILVAFSGVLYLAGQGTAFTGVCSSYYVFDLCHHPGRPLWVAAAFVAFGFMFRTLRT